jgi:hypothetical protein
MEIVFLVGGCAYPIPERAAIELRDRIREHVSDDRMLGYLADVISEDLTQGESPEPLDLSPGQIEALADILFGASPDGPRERLRQACQRFAEGWWRDWPLRDDAEQQTPIPMRPSRPAADSGGDGPTDSVWSSRRSFPA